MIRFAIICLLNLLVKGDSTDGHVSLMKLNSALSEAVNYMDNQLLNEDSAIFFGNTRSGRSTLINYLMGNKLQVKQYSKFNPRAIVKADNKSVGPEIDIGSVSITSAPKGWTSKIFPNLTLWDVPGFGDNRGTIQDLTNSFYLYRLIKSVKSLKIILVVDIKDIKQDYNQQFLSLLKRIENLFGDDFKYYFNSTSIIFTKVPANTPNRVPIDKEYIKYHLKNYLLLDTALDWSEILRNFTRFLLNNNDRIALFKGISLVSKATGDIDADIISVLNKSKSIQSNLLQDVHPSISASSMIQLLRAKEIIELEQMLPKLGDVLIQALYAETEKLGNSETVIDEKKLNIFILKLIDMKEKLSFIITNDTSLYQTIEKMFSINLTIDLTTELTFDMQQKMMRNLELIYSVESVLHIIISKALKTKLDFIIFDLILKIKSIITNVELALSTLSSDETIYDTTISKLPGEPDSTDAPGEPNVPDSTDAPDESDSTDAPDEPNVPDESDSTDAPGEPNVPDSTDAPNVPDESDSTDAPDEPNVPDSTDAPDEPNVPDSTDAPDEPIVPDSTDAPNIPDESDSTDAPNVPDSTDAPGSTDASDSTDAPNVPDSTVDN